MNKLNPLCDFGIDRLIKKIWWNLRPFGAPPTGPLISLQFRKDRRNVGTAVDEVAQHPQLRALCRDGRDRGMGDRKDEIAGADVARAQRKLNCIGAVADTDRMANADVIGEGCLEHLDFSAENVYPAFENPSERGVYRSPVHKIACAGIGLGDCSREILWRHEIIYK